MFCDSLTARFLRNFMDKQSTADTGSMTVAANILHLTQGAVSQQIKRLEETFDCVLFERDGRRLELSPVGERFLGKAKRLLGMNDEIWVDMTAHPVYGKLRVGVPYDLVGTHFPPVFKAFGEAYPNVEVSLMCATSPELSDAMGVGSLDLAVVEETAGVTNGECLRVEQLVWVGARGGNAHLKRPLPISMVADSCSFRPVVLAALRDQGIEWRTVFESGNLEATTATVRSDLAVTAWLASTIPADLEILSGDDDLPTLPNFSINLRLPSVVPPAAQEFARYVRERLVRIS
jgi:DNA-binding transcriptional LysR family regulator